MAARIVVGKNEKNNYGRSIEFMLLTSWACNRLGITYRIGAKTRLKVTGASRPDCVAVG